MLSKFSLKVEGPYNKKINKKKTIVFFFFLWNEENYYVEYLCCYKGLTDTNRKIFKF